MQIKSVVAGAAIGLLATVGSAYADETFDTMRGVPVEALDTEALDGVRAGHLRILVFAPCPSSPCVFRGAAFPIEQHGEIDVNVDVMTGAVVALPFGSISAHTGGGL